MFYKEGVLKKILSFLNEPENEPAFYKGVAKLIFNVTLVMTSVSSVYNFLAETEKFVLWNDIQFNYADDLDVSWNLLSVTAHVLRILRKNKLDEWIRKFQNSKGLEVTQNVSDKHKEDSKILSLTREISCSVNGKKKNKCPSKHAQRFNQTTV